MNFREYVNEGTVKKSFDGYNFEWDGKVITMFNKEGKKLATKDAPSLTSAKMEMMIADLNKNLDEAKINLEKIYNNIKNPYDANVTNISGVDYDKLDDIDVDAGTMFYAINANGKKVGTRAKTNFKAKEVMIGGKSYIVTNKLSYPGKKYISELMITTK